MNDLPPLDIDADLDLQVDGETVRVRGTGPQVVVELPSLRAGAALMRSGPFQTRRRARLDLIDRLLRRAGLTAEVRLSGALLARLGTGSRPGAVARLLRLGALEVRPTRSLGTFVRRRPKLAAATAGLAGLVAGFLLRRRS